MTDEQGTIDAFTDDTGEDGAGSADPDRAEDAGDGATYRWDPEGEPCADCGAVAERRWRAAAGFVCPACKWE